jgi:ethanolamine ammonia-lyase small subunit
MKLHIDQQFSVDISQNRWQQLKQFTDARIALGRAGSSLPTKPQLEFQLAHAQAKDAVLKQLDVAQLEQQLAGLQHPIMHIQSAAEEKDTYLKRPDLGRELDEASRQALMQLAAQQQQYDVVFVVGDGLSARAIEDNIPHFLPQLLQMCQQQNWSIAPIMLATGSRVALGDEVAQILKTRMLVMLIGERPGLSSPDSLGIYYTLDAFKGCQDAARNCISNIRPAGLSYPVATQRLLGLMQGSLQLGESGVNLKDQHEMVLDNTAPKNQTRLF